MQFAWLKVIKVVDLLNAFPLNVRNKIPRSDMS